MVCLADLGEVQRGQLEAETLFSIWFLLFFAFPVLALHTHTHARERTGNSVGCLCPANVPFGLGNVFCSRT